MAKGMTKNFRDKKQEELSLLRVSLEEYMSPLNIIIRTIKKLNRKRRSF